jgi:hypothetical protein
LRTVRRARKHANGGQAPCRFRVGRFSPIGLAFVFFLPTLLSVPPFTFVSLI